MNSSGAHPSNEPQLELRRFDRCGTGQLQQQQWLPIDLATAWDFFSTPDNLNALTPQDLQFHVLTPAKEMYAGQVLAYRIRLAPMWYTTWITHITRCVEREVFIDEQRVGPYSLWVHEHRFTEQDGGVLMQDTVTYRVPAWALAWPLQVWYIEPQLRKIFSYRQQVLQQRFPVETG
jgi:ligand-binding SRPBCC domain-containing protein